MAYKQNILSKIDSPATSLPVSQNPFDHLPEDQRPQVYSVSEITAGVRGLLEQAFDTVWIEGEISGLRVAQSKHAYFVLKDDRAQIRCVHFRNQRAGLKFTPEDGDQVLLMGRMSVYDARGEYQVIVETMEPRGLGALQKAFEQLKEKLDKEGLFSEEHKRPLPDLPWHVGVVTSGTGAAIQDILHVLKRRNPLLSVLLHPVRVQGEGSAQEIADAIQTLNQQNHLDVLIVGRGGGSIEDLWAFNEEPVARAIHASRIPVISAVGHEIDFTIADFVADVRAPTPSAAAEIVTPVLEELVETLRYLTQRLVSALEDELEDQRDHLKQMMDRRFFREPLQILQPSQQRLDDLNARLLRSLDQWVILQRQRLTGTLRRLLTVSPENKLPHYEQQRESLEQRLIRTMTNKLQREQQRFEGSIRNLKSLSPLNILDRGYSITTSQTTGKALLNSNDSNPGDRVRVRLSKGHLDCTVDKAVE